MHDDNPYDAERGSPRRGATSVDRWGTMIRHGNGIWWNYEEARVAVQYGWTARSAAEYGRDATGMPFLGAADAGGWTVW